MGGLTVYSQVFLRKNLLTERETGQYSSQRKWILRGNSIKARDAGRDSGKSFLLVNRSESLGITLCGDKVFFLGKALLRHSSGAFLTALNEPSTCFFGQFCVPAKVLFYRILSAC